MFHSIVAFLATVYNASPFAASQSDSYAMANASSYSSSSAQSTAFYRPSNPAEPIRNTRRRLLLTTTSTPSTPTLRRQPEISEAQAANAELNRQQQQSQIPPPPQQQQQLRERQTTLRRQPEISEARPRHTPSRDNSDPTVLTDANWLTNRRFVRGDRLERSGPRDNLMLLAEEEEQNAQRALQAANAELNRQQQQSQIPPPPQQQQQLRERQTTLRRQPEISEARPRHTPSRDNSDPTVLTDANWLTNRRFVRGDRLERSGPRDNLMLLAEEEEEQNAQRALQAANAELNRQQQQSQLSPTPPPQQQQQLRERQEQQTVDGVAPQHQEQQVQQESYSEASGYSYRSQRATTIAVTPQFESFITDATYFPTANISTASEDEPFVLRLPARDARLAGQSVAEWAGLRTTKKCYAGLKRSFSDYLDGHDDYPEENRTINHHIQDACPQKKGSTHEMKWKNTQKNLERMDDMYNTTFSAWVQAEENALTTATHLKRLAYEYSLDRLIHAIKWIITDWRLQNIATLIKHVISDWDSDNGYLNVARMLREVTEGWEQIEFVTLLVADVMAFRDEPDHIKASFLRSLCENWDFSKLSAFLMRLDSNIDHKIKCELLHRAAKTEQRKFELRLRLKRQRTQLHL